MLPETANIDEMKETEEKQLLKILKDDCKPFVRKYDGYAVKMTEDKQIEYLDWENNERTLKVPAGSYVVVDSDSSYPKIVTSEDFEAKYKFTEGDKPKIVEKTDDSPKMGIALIADNN